MDQKNKGMDLPGGPVVKNPPANAGDAGSIPGLGRCHMLQSNLARVPRTCALKQEGPLQ